MKSEVTKIIQIIPADGWRAHFEEQGNDDILQRVVCFALVEVTEGGAKRQEVRPMSWSDVGVDFCQNTSNFTEVSHERQEAP